MQFRVTKYDKQNVTPQWIEFTGSSDQEGFILKKQKQAYFNVIFKGNRYISQITHTHINRITKVMEITVGVISRIKEEDECECDAQIFSSSQELHEYEEQLQKDIDDKTRADKKVLTAVKKLTSKYKVARLREYLRDSGKTFKYEIVERQKIYGKKQKENYWFKHVWITQYTGISGDDYNGTIFVPITDTLFFKFDYTM